MANRSLASVIRYLHRIGPPGPDSTLDAHLLPWLARKPLAGC